MFCTPHASAISKRTWRYWRYIETSKVRPERTSVMSVRSAMSPSSGNAGGRTAAINDERWNAARRVVVADGHSRVVGHRHAQPGSTDHEIGGPVAGDDILVGVASEDVARQDGAGARV